MRVSLSLMCTTHWSSILSTISLIRPSQAIIHGGMESQLELAVKTTLTRPMWQLFHQRGPLFVYIYYMYTNNCVFERYLFIVRLDALAVEVVAWHVVGVIGLEVVATGQHGNKQ